MSRVIVKNIPAYTTPARLKEHFLQNGGPGGTITDIKVAHKQDGTSRRFAFIGYKTEEEAQKAMKWFNRTFIDTSKITVDVVEVCSFLLHGRQVSYGTPQKGAKDAPAPRPNKRPKLENVSTPSDASLEHKKSKESAQTDNTKPPKKRTELEEEFIQVMRPRTQKGPAWLDAVDPDESKVASSSKITLAAPPSPPSKKGKERESSLNVDDQQNSGADELAMDEDIKDQDIDDMEWMKRHMSKGMRLEDESTKEFFQDEGDGFSDTDERMVCVLCISLLNLCS
jgi:multiple RNA-binding domain-containing protein 1